MQFVRRLTTKELVFLRFVALRNARVNGKNEEIRSKETAWIHRTEKSGKTGLSDPRAD
jgi:hypothetical protein